MFLLFLSNVALEETPTRTRPLATRPLATPTATFNREPVVISGSLIIAGTILAAIGGSVFFFYYKYLIRQKIIENDEPESCSDKEKLNEFKTGKKKHRRRKKYSNNSVQQHSNVDDQEKTPLLQSRDQDSYYSYYYEEEDGESNKGTKTNNFSTNLSTFVLSESEESPSDHYEIPPEADKGTRRGSITKTASETDALNSLRFNLNLNSPKVQKLRQSSIFFGQDKAQSLESGMNAGITAQSSLQIPSYITDALKPSDDGSSSSSELPLAKIPVDM